MTTAEGVNTAQNTRLNTVETSLDGKASSSSVAALSSEVTAARNGSPSLAAQLTSMRQTVVDGLAGKASTTALTTLSSRVGTAEASLTTVAQTAADASGKANAIVGHVLDVNGYISGTKSENDGVRSTYEVLADSFAIRATGTAARTEFISGIWYAYDAANAVRSSWGRPHGASSHGLTWWTGPNSVAKGSETKANAYVYVSMNTTGGPRFGGTDVPTGGDLTVDSNIGQTKGGTGYNMIAGSGWQTLSGATLTSVTVGEMIVASQEFGVPSTAGGAFVGEVRLVDGALRF